MKKKHLKSLVGIEKWMSAEKNLSPEAEKAFLVIKNALESMPEETLETSSVLPPPVEIYGEPEALALYSDGGCRGNPGPGAFAYVIQEHNGEILAQGVDYESLTTNNKMELKGPLQGLRDLQEILKERGKDPRLTKVKVLTDSKYVVDGMKTWITGWKARGWKKADNKPPENLEIWQDLDQVQTEFLKIDWAWIKGHAGHPQNEYCDRKANEAMDAHTL